MRNINFEKIRIEMEKSKKQKEVLDLEKINKKSKYKIDNMISFISEKSSKGSSIDVNEISQIYSSVSFINENIFENNKKIKEFDNIIHNLSNELLMKTRKIDKFDEKIKEQKSIIMHDANKAEGRVIEDMFAARQYLAKG